MVRERSRSASVGVRKRRTKAAAAEPEQPALIADPAPVSSSSQEVEDVHPVIEEQPVARETATSSASEASVDSIDDESSLLYPSTGTGSPDDYNSAIPAPSELDWLDRYERWVPLALTLLCGFTRFYRLDCPPGVVFDEYHFGRFTNQYSESRILCTRASLSFAASSAAKIHR